METKRKQSVTDFLRRTLKSLNLNPFFFSIWIGLTIYEVIYLQCIKRLDSGSNPKYAILANFGIIGYSLLWGYVWSKGKAAVKYWLPTLLLPICLCIMEFVNFTHVLRFAFFSQLFHFSFWTVVWFLLWELLLEGSFAGESKSEPVARRVRTVFVCIQSAIEFLVLWLSVSIMINAVLNGGINSDAVVAMCQTNRREAWEYFWGINHGAILVGGMTITFLLCTILLIVTRRRGYPSDSGSPELPRRIGWLFRLEAACFILFSVVVGWRMADMYSKRTMTWNTIKSYSVYRRNIESFKALIDKRRQIIDQYLAQYRPEEDSDNIGGIFVLVIGESLDRRYMGCYGAEPDTTPFQTALRNQPGAVFFDRAYACHVQTTRVVPMMLTMYNQYLSPEQDISDAELSLSILDIAKINGFKTYWFSNQEKISSNNSIITAIATSADKTLFMIDIKKGMYDHQMLPLLKETQFPDRSLVIIHLIGNHFPYGMRFPQDYKFPDGLSLYEQSVYYNDDVLRQITEFFLARGAKMIGYVSDHSDAVSIGKGHDPRPGKFYREMIEIPMWVWVSQEYRDQYPVIFEKLQKASGKVVTNDLMFNLLQDMMSIRFRPEMEDFSPLSANYILDREDIKPKTLDGLQEIPSP